MAGNIHANPFLALAFGITHPLNSKQESAQLYTVERVLSYILSGRGRRPNSLFTPWAVFTQCWGLIVLLQSLRMNILLLFMLAVHSLAFRFGDRHSQTDMFQSLLVKLLFSTYKGNELVSVHFLNNQYPETRLCFPFLGTLLGE